MAAAGALGTVGESTLLWVRKVLPETEINAEDPCSGDWLVDAVLSAGVIPGSEGTTGSDGAIAGAVMVASAGLRISLCGARLCEVVAGAGNALETVAYPVPICPCVRKEEAMVSCAKAAELIWLDTGTRKQAAHNTNTTEDNVRRCLFRL